MTPPILLDSWFTDLPRRRHIDMGRFGPLVPAVGAGWPSTVFDQFGRRYDNVIFHRKTLTWTPLTHYELHPNPVRIWQRWKPVPFFSPKLNWRPIPDEIDFYGGDENNP